MIASLPMYDRPETQAANDRYWDLIRAHIDGATPETLTRTGDIWDHWRDPALVLSQTCGLPYRNRLHGKVALVGTPVLDLDCPPGQYFSLCLVRRSDPRNSLQAFENATIAVNDPLSQSGWAAPQNLAHELGFGFTKTLLTGSHIASARAVAQGKAEIAAVDALTWTLIKRFDDIARDLRVLTQTPATPTLPYITALGRDAGKMRAAIGVAIETLDPKDKNLLGLKGITQIPAEDYLALPTPKFPTPLSN